MTGGDGDTTAPRVDRRRLLGAAALAGVSLAGLRAATADAAPATDRAPFGNMYFRGEWAPDTAYNADDVVTHDGGLYLAIDTFTSQSTFGASRWTPLAPPVPIVTPSGGDDTAAINGALRTGIAVLFGGTFTVGAGGAGDNGAALSMPSHSLLILWHATLRLADNAQIPMVMNVHPDRTGTDADSDITIAGMGNAVIDGNASNNPHVASPLTSQWKSVPVLFCNVAGLVIEDITIKDPSAWGISPQNCSAVRLRRIEARNDASTTNQAAVQVYGSCDDCIIEDITGQTDDDCVALLTYTKIQRGAFVYSFTGGHQRNISVRNLDGAWATQTGNAVRLLNGDSYSIKNVSISGVRNTSTAASHMVAFGPTLYLTTAPDPADCAGISISGLNGGGLQSIVGFDQSCSGVSIADVNVDQAYGNLIGGVTSGVVLYHVACGDVVISYNSSTSQLVSFPADVKITNLSLRDVVCSEAQHLLHNSATIVGLDISDVIIGLLTGALIASDNPELGVIDKVYVRSQAPAGPHYTSPVALRMGPTMPFFSKRSGQADTEPKPTAGSIIICDHTMDPTGGGFATGAQYVGDGQAWNRAVVLANL